MKVKIETRLVSNFYRSRNHRGIVESRGNGHSVSVVVVVVCEVAILVVVDDVVYGRRYGSSVACSEVAVLIKHIHRRLLRTYVPRLFQFSLSLREKEREREREFSMKPSSIFVIVPCVVPRCFAGLHTFRRCFNTVFHSYRLHRFTFCLGTIVLSLLAFFPLHIFGASPCVHLCR